MRFALDGEIQLLYANGPRLAAEYYAHRLINTRNQRTSAGALWLSWVIRCPLHCTSAPATVGLILVSILQIAMASRMILFSGFDGVSADLPGRSPTRMRPGCGSIKVAYTASRCEQLVALPSQNSNTRRLRDPANAASTEGFMLFY